MNGSLLSREDNKEKLASYNRKHRSNSAAKLREFAAATEPVCIRVQHMNKIRQSINQSVIRTTFLLRNSSADKGEKMHEL